MYLPPDPESFFSLVWEIVRQIPAGKVSTYGQIASMIPPPPEVEPPAYDRLAARWVGQAMRRTPPGSNIPWQRVINSQGTISFPAGSAAAQEQRRLLEMEAVLFDERGRVDFEEAGWDGPPAAWLAEHNLLPPRRLGRPGHNEADNKTQLNLF
jgi:methylated-DNA-protein-cysteine methyltransferase-like protein